MEDEKQEVEPGELLVALILLVPGVLLRGWVLKLTWGWFILPLGALPIGTWQAVGLIVIWNMLANRKREKLKKGDLLAGLLQSAVDSGFFLGFAALAHLLMGG